MPAVSPWPLLPPPPPPRCTDTPRPPPDDGGDGDTTTDGGDGGVPRSAKTMAGNSYRRLRPCRAPRASVALGDVGDGGGGAVVAGVLVAAVGVGVGECHKIRTCDFVERPDDRTL